MTEQDDAAEHRSEADAPDAMALAEAQRIIAAQREAVLRKTDVDPRLLFATWGVAWLVGFLVLHGVSAPSAWLPIPVWVGGTVFAVCILAGIAVTVVHSVRRSSGTRGATRTEGTRYGVAWSVSFLGIVALGAALGRAHENGDIAADTLSTVMMAASCLIVATFYLCGGALWQDRMQYGLGVWIIVALSAAVLVGLPAGYLVMAVGGGGGFLLVALALHLRGRRVAASGELP